MCPKSTAKRPPNVVTQSSLFEREKWISFSRTRRKRMTDRICRPHSTGRLCVQVPMTTTFAFLSLSFPYYIPQRHRRSKCSASHTHTLSLSLSLSSRIVYYVCTPLLPAHYFSMLVSSHPVDEETQASRPTGPWTSALECTTTIQSFKHHI